MKVKKTDNHDQLVKRGLAILRGELIVGQPIRRISTKEWLDLGFPLRRTYATFVPQRTGPAPENRVSFQV